MEKRKMRKQTKGDTDIESEVENCRGRICKERGVEGKGEEYAIMENINVTSLDQNKEALIKSKAKVIFSQEHTIRKEEKKKMERR